MLLTDVFLSIMFFSYVLNERSGAPGFDQEVFLFLQSVIAVTINELKTYKSSTDYDIL